MPHRLGEFYTLIHHIVVTPIFLKLDYPPPWPLYL